MPENRRADQIAKEVATEERMDILVICYQQKKIIRLIRKPPPPVDNYQIMDRPEHVNILRLRAENPADTRIRKVRLQNQPCEHVD